MNTTSLKEPNCRDRNLSRCKLVLTACALLAIHVLLFSRTLSYELVWDDVPHIAENPLLKGSLRQGLLAGQQEHLDPEVMKATHFQPAYESYRPVLFITYWIEYQLFGLSAKVMHGTNVLISTLTIMMGLLVVLRLGARRWIALFAAALLALHPLVVEPVSYISARGDMLAALFALFATWLLLRSMERRDRPVKSVTLTLGACVALLLSLLSKETCIGIFGVWFVMSILIGPWRPWASRLLPLLVTIGLYIFIRTTALGAEQATVDSHLLLRALFQLPGHVLRYLLLVILPFDISTERLHDSAFDWAGIIAAALSIASAAWIWRASSNDEDRHLLRHAGIGLFWFVGIIAPAAVAIAETQVLADRYAYLPLLGMGLTTGSLYQLCKRRMGNTRKVLIGATSIWGAMVLFVAWTQIGVWHDNTRLYEHALQQEPHSSMANYRVGYLRAIAGDWPRAAWYFKRAVELDPGNIRAHNNLGLSYIHIEQFSAAEKILKAGLKRTSDQNYRGWYNLATLYTAMGQMSRACAAIRRSR